MKNVFSALLRDASARSFALRMTPLDVLTVAVLGVSAACAGFFLGKETGVLWRGLVALQAAVGVCSCFVILRSLVPMALSLSFADMMRLRMSFSLWTVCLVVLVALSPVTRVVLSSFSAVSASLVLTLAAVALTVRFLQRGSLAALTLAFACAGLSLGVSVFGIVAAVAAVVVLRVAANTLLREGDLPWWDELDQRVLDYFDPENPLFRARVNWSLALCFFFCAALSFFAVRADFASAVAERLRIPWDYGFSLDGAVFFVVTAVLPFVAVVGRVGVASDIAERLGAGMTVLYVAIGTFSALMLLNPALILLVSGVFLRVETSVVVLSSVFYAYSLLMSATCILIDIRCRGRLNDRDAGGVGLRWVGRVVYVLVCLAPLALVALLAAGFLLRQGK